MTFKFSGVGRDRTTPLADFVRALGPGLHGYECVWLLSNTVTERTLLAWRD